MTVYDFVPPKLAPFLFQPTLDGNVYTGAVTWNLYGQRLYLSLTAADGTRIFTLPFIGSTVGIDLKSLAWSHGIVTGQTMKPHGYRVTDTIPLTIAATLPDAYNGTRNVLITKPDTFAFPMASNPGAPTLLGHLDADVNIAGGYFQTSTLVFNEDAQQIEVTP